MLHGSHAGAKYLWVAYGPLKGGVLLADAEVVLHGLHARPQLNQKSGKLMGWDGTTGRFKVVVASGERVKVKPANIRARGSEAQPSWECLEGNLMLPMDIMLSTAYFLTARTVAAFSSSSRAARAGLWLRPAAEALWEALLVRQLGPSAIDISRHARPSSAGPSLYRGARALRDVFRVALEVVRGGVHTESGGAEVVACPVIRNLHNAGVGAQGAVRQAAGRELEEAIALLAKPVAELSVTLVPGGALAKRVALTVTEPPLDLWGAMQGGLRDQLQGILAFLERLHGNLLRAVREAGFRSLAMPTLCTGGVGMPAHLVAIAALRAVHRDFCEHPSDPIRVRVACFEPEHVPAFNTIKDHVLEHFYMPELADSIIMTSLYNF